MSCQAQPTSGEISHFPRCDPPQGPFNSFLAQRLIGRLGPRFARRGRKRGVVVLGAPPGDPHSLPTAIVGDLLRGVGFEVLDMGANAPAEDREARPPVGLASRSALLIPLPPLRPRGPVRD